MTNPWPADKVERWPIAKLTPYAKNARTHTPEQIAQISASIEEFGFTIPVLVDTTGSILAGHGRVLAAERLGLTEIPTMVADGWTAEQKRAYRLIDNKLTLNSAWDDSLLRIELQDLNIAGFDLDLTGFTQLEIAALNEPTRTAETEWQGMPEFEQEDQKPFRSITVHFKDHAAVTEFIKRLELDISDKARWSWFPQIAYENFMGERYATEANAS